MAILLWTLTIPVVMKIEKDPEQRGAMIQAINRSNFLVIGFPIVESICGKENLAATAMTIVGMLLVNNIYAVVVLEVFRGVAFVTLLAFFAASPTTTSYTMADQMNSDGELARDCVVFATALVALTMFCWIFFYKSIGMF